MRQDHEGDFEICVGLFSCIKYFAVSSASFDSNCPSDFSHSTEYATVQPLNQHSPPVMFVEAPLRRRSATTSAKPATETGSKLPRCTTLLGIAHFTSSVSALTVSAVATGSSTSTRTTLAIVTTHHTLRRSVRALLLDVCCRYNLSR